MEMELFEKDGITWTRFKLTHKRFPGWKTILRCVYGVDTDNPVKQNSRYIYFEKEGDWISGRS